MHTGAGSRTRSSRAGHLTAPASSSRCTCAGQTQVDIFTVAADGTDLQQIIDTRREDGFADWGPYGA